MNTDFTFEYLAKEYAPILQALSVRMDAGRRTHTLAVAKESLQLARIFDLDEQDTKRLFVASLLHDITKAIDFEGQLTLANELGLRLTQEDLASPPVLHSFTGALVASRDFPTYTDGTIVEAIFSHTVGKADMSLIDKLLFLADYIEGTRKQPICIKTRKAFYSALSESCDKASTLDRFVLLIAENTVEYLRNNGRTVHPHTQETIRSLTDKLSAKKG